MYSYFYDKMASKRFHRRTYALNDILELINDDFDMKSYKKQIRKYIETIPKYKDFCALVSFGRVSNLSHLQIIQYIRKIPSLCQCSNSCNNVCTKQCSYCNRHKHAIIDIFIDKLNYDVLEYITKF